MKALINHFKESGLTLKVMLRTQSSRPFPKCRKLLSFGILAKGGPHDIFLESFHFTNGWKWHNFCKIRRLWRWFIKKLAVTIIFLAMSIFISQICPPKLAWKSSFYRNNWNAAAGQRRLWRHWKLLGIKVLIKHFKENGLAPETMLRRQRSRPFAKFEKKLFFAF